MNAEPRIVAARRRDLGVVLAFAGALSLWSVPNAVHLDETYFLAVARHILVDPLHPLAFPFNWFGRTAPAWRLNVHPMLPSYWLALTLLVGGGREWVTRLLCLPFDLAASAGLYLLAARFLAEPLAPVLIVLACPAYLINMAHLMGEKWIGAFGFPGLYALVRSFDAGEADARWFWGSAALLACAMLSKYSAVFLLLTAGLYCVRRGVPARRIAAYLAVAGLPAAAAILWGSGAWGGGAATLVKAIHFTAGMPQSRWPHRLRSFLAFTGGCGAVTAVWPWLAVRRWARRPLLLAACLGAVALLFSPLFDIGRVRVVDRFLGAALALGGLLSVVGAFDAETRRAGEAGSTAEPDRPGRAAGDAEAAGARPFLGPGPELWLPWIAVVAGLQLWVYWSVVSRFVLFLVPPLVFAWAGRLEACWSGERRRACYAASLAGTAALGLALASVDARFADGQRRAARLVAERYIAHGRRVWFTGHWGLQHYLEAAGAEGLDADRGGWDEVRRGDVVVVPELNTNTNALRPRRPVLANVRKVWMDSRIPLRLIGDGEEVQAGFYSSMQGFLPFSVSRRPLGEIAIVEVL